MDRALLGRKLIKRKIKTEHVDARLAEYAPLPAFSVSGDQRLDVLGGNAARLGDALQLILGRGRTDLRIETAA